MTLSAFPSLRATHLRGACVLAVALLAGACTYSDTAGQPGTLTVRPPLSLPPVGAPPPPELGDTAQTIMQGPRPANAVYAGVMHSTFNPLGRCANPMRINGFKVNGDRVDFGLYRGTIGADGKLEMQYRDTWIYGQFVGTHFQGAYWAPYPQCTYDISMDAAGP